MDNPLNIMPSRHTYTMPCLAMFFGLKPYTTSDRYLPLRSGTSDGLSLSTNNPTIPDTAVMPPRIRKNVVQLPFCVSPSKATKITISAATGITDKITSTKPRLVTSVTSVIHAENAASLDSEPNKVITQSMITNTITAVTTPSAATWPLPKKAKLAVTSPHTM